MSKSYEFRTDELPDLNFSPLKAFSVLSEDPCFHNQVISALEKCFYYKAHTCDIFVLMDLIEKSSSTIYFLKAVQGDNTITWSSEDPESYIIQLTDQSFSHHAYVGRYLRFSQQIAGKGSLRYGKKFSALVQRSTEKYTKDVKAVISDVLTNASVTIFSDKAIQAEVPALLERVEGKIEKHVISLFSDLRPMSMAVLRDELTDFYEYLALLHFNSYPQLNNSHVAATTTYRNPLPGGEKIIEKLYLTSVSDVSPLLFGMMAADPKCLSAQATLQTESQLSFYNGKNLYSWRVRGSKG